MVQSGLERGLRGLEWTARFFLVNIPCYVIGKFCEIDRCGAIVIAYLLFQLVGLCWAFLVNAAFALACRVTYFLPPIDLAGAAAVLSSQINNNKSTLTFNLSNAVPSDPRSLLSSPTNTGKLIAAFYVSYASVRVVVSFAQSVFAIALESIIDFPDASLKLSKGGIFTLKLTPLVFVPALILEIGLISADFCCYHTTLPGDTSRLPEAICHGIGLTYLTSNYPEVRRIIFYAVVLMVMQLWQAKLHQFPNWALAFRRLTPLSRIVAQIAVVFVSLFTIVVALFVSVTPTNVSSIESLVCGVFLGWTVWLCGFSPVLVATHGVAWAERVTQQSLQQLAAYLRLSHIFILTGLFFCVCFTTGFLQAQLDITLATIVIPALYCWFYLAAAACIRAGPALLFRAVPIALLFSLGVTRWANAGGRGGKTY